MTSMSAYVTSAAVLLSVVGCGGSRGSGAGGSAADQQTQEPTQNGPCEPGPNGPPVSNEHALSKAYPSCEAACWELESLAPPGGGMPASAKLLSCATAADGRSVRCVVQHERVCIEPDRPY